MNTVRADAPETMRKSGLRIAFVISALRAGGSERQASLLCSYWAEQGHAVTLITLDNTPDHYGLAPGVRRINMRPQNLSLRRLRLLWHDLRALRRTLRQENPDCIISFLDATNYKTIAAASGLGIPLIASERTAPTAYDRLRSSALFHKLARRLLYPRATALVAQTQSVAKWMRERNLSGNVWTIPNILETREALSPAPRDHTVLAVGRFSHEKGHDVLVRGFAAVAAAHPDWRLRLVGDGQNRGKLDSLVAALGIVDRVDFSGTKKNLDEEYRRAGIFVLPSRLEGFPNVLLEAMRADCPILCSDCPAASREIIMDSHDGMLFTSENVEDLARKLDRLMSDASLRKALSASAASRLDRYSPRTILAEWDRLFASLRLCPEKSDVKPAANPPTCR